MNSKFQEKKKKFQDKVFEQVRLQKSNHQVLQKELEQPFDLKLQFIQLTDKFQEKKNDIKANLIQNNTIFEIGVLNLSLNKQINEKLIVEWINAYLGIKVKVMDYQMALYYQQNNFYILDLQTNKNYLLEQNEQSIINVFSIFNVLFEIKPKTIYSLVAIIDQDIYDPYIPNSNIVGRACGKKVSVVQYTDEKQEFYSTIVHELLHTFGFSHCNQPDCLMNKFINQSMQLCINDLEKLLLLKKQDIKKRYEKIFKISTKLGFKKECELLQQMIKQQS